MKFTRYVRYVLISSIFILCAFSNEKKAIDDNGEVVIITKVDDSKTWAEIIEAHGHTGKPSVDITDFSQLPARS